MIGVAALALVATACGGGDDGGSELTTDTTSADVATSTTSATDGTDGAEDGVTIAVETGGSDAGSTTDADGDPSGGDTPVAGADGTDGDAPAPGEGDEAAETGATSAAESAAAIEALEGDELEEFLARRYESFWLAFGQAREAPTANPATDFPALADLAVGQQLEAAYAELVDMATEGRALQDPAERAVPGLDNDAAHRIRIEQVDGGSAELVACFVNDRQSIQVADGAVISDLVVTVQAEATMVRADGTWKLLRSQAVALDPGVGGCWLEDESRYPW